MHLIEFGCLKKSAAEISVIVRAVHPEVGIVVQELTEDGVAVLSVPPRIEDVLVPKDIDLPIGHDVAIGIVPLQGEEAPVVLFYDVTSLRGPTGPFVTGLKLQLEQVEVQRGNVVHFNGGGGVRWLICWRVRNSVSLHDPETPLVVLSKLEV